MYIDVLSQALNLSKNEIFTKRKTSSGTTADSTADSTANDSSLHQSHAQINWRIVEGRNPQRSKREMGNGTCQQKQGLKTTVGE